MVNSKILAIENKVRDMSMDGLKKKGSLHLKGLFLAMWFIWSPTAMSSLELDRQYLFDSIAFIRPVDNSDNLFSETISRTYRDYFSKQGRFILNDLTSAETLLNRSKISYAKLIDSPDILKQMMLSSHTESLIRTKIKKQGTSYFFTLDWLHAPHMELIHSLSFSIPEFSEGSSFESKALGDLVEKNLDRLLSEVPFQGYVTGRDQATATVNLGSLAHLHKNDILMIGTIEEVKTHPLLKSVLDWRLSSRGKLVVEQVEEGMAFCRVLEEDTSKPIARYQKIIQILPGVEVTDYKPVESQKVFSPSLGWIGGSLLLGNYSRQFNSFSGGGLALGAKAEGEVWFTKRWFSGGEVSYRTWNFSQKDISSGVETPASLNGGVSGSVLSYKLAVGYAFLLSESLLGPKGWIKLGNWSSSYNLPRSTVVTQELTGPLHFNSIMLGIGGDIPLKEHWGILVDLNYRLYTSATQSWYTTETIGSASEAGFFMGGYYRLTPRLTLRGGLSFEATSVDFSGGSSINQKTVTIAPALLYYF